MDILAEVWTRIYERAVQCQSVHGPCFLADRALAEFKQRFCAEPERTIRRVFWVRRDMIDRSYKPGDYLAFSPERTPEYDTPLYL